MLNITLFVAIFKSIDRLISKLINTGVFVILSVIISACGVDQPSRSPATIVEPTLTSALAQATDFATLTATNPPVATETPTPTPSETPIPTPDFFAGEYPPGENDYLIPLTVRHVTAEGASFFFELRNPVDGMLVYRDVETRLQGTLEIFPDQTRQMVTIEGLVPGGEYEARLIIGNAQSGYNQPFFDGREWNPIHFRTAGEIWPLRIGVLGDASFGDEATSQLVGLMAAQDLDFVIHTGDVVYETDASDVLRSYVGKFFTPFAPLLAQGPVYTVLGNHDYDYAVRWQDAPFYDYAFPPFPTPEFSFKMR